jgi:hypothetical protein
MVAKMVAKRTQLENILILILMWYVARNQSWYVATGRELA